MLYRPWIILACVLCFTSQSHRVLAFQLLNGQIITDGFSIIDSPQPNTPVNGNINIAVDVSANGKLQSPSGIDDLEIYLVSTDLNLNLTVTSGSDFLGGEPGSTVKHLQFFPPACAETGQYNLTFYEVSHTGDDKFFIVTPIPVSVTKNPSSSGLCINNSIQSQSQNSSPPPGGNPFLSSNGGGGSPPTVTSLPGMTTVTVPAGGTFPFPFLPTMTFQGSPPIMTVVVVSSSNTVTTALQGTTTSPIERTMTTTMTMSDISRFIPVVQNGADLSASFLSPVSLWLVGIVLPFLSISLLG